MITHCQPNGILGTNELPCPNISAATATTIHATTGVGNRRGVMVFCHGLQVNDFAAIPFVLSDSQGLLSSYNLTFANLMATDGWEIIAPIYQEDNFNGIPSQGLFNDIQNDTGNGARYLASTLHWWDHVVDYIYAKYVPGIPIIMFGGSLGGAKTLHVVTRHPQNNLTAFMAHVPATVFEVASTEFVSQNFGLLNWSGIDMHPTDLNSITMPGIVGYGTNDGGLGYNNTTVASGSNNTTAANVAAAGNLYVASFTGFQTSVGVLVTGLTGGTGQAVFNFTGTSTSGGNHLTGVTLVSGSGTLTTGLPAIQNWAPTLVSNQNAAQPSNPITANVTPDGHEFTKADAGIYTNPTGISGSVALSTLTGTLNVGSTSGGINHTALVSGAAAIQDTVGAWHTMTWTGSTTTTLTGVSYTGSNSALVNNSSVISQTNYAVGASYYYFATNNIDPICPKVW